MDEDISLKDVLVGAGGALLPFIPLELIGQGQAALIAAAIAGITFYVCSDEITGFAKKRLPVFQQDPQAFKSWLVERVGEPVQPKSDLRPTVAPSEVVTEKMPAIERMRVLPENQQATRRLNEEDELPDPLDDDYEDELLPAPRSGMFVFFEVLRTFTPTLKKIYIGTLPDGTHLFCEAKDLCHVALAGSTGGGKSSVARMIVAQLCKAGARVLLLNPHYTRYDIDADEDWTPFDPYLYRPAMECRSYGIISQYLEKVATDILPKRLDRYAHSQPVGKPYFLVLDELPAIVSHCKEASGYLSTILREGRKVGIYLIVASQDFLVKTLFPGGEGGAVRECFRTAIYVGGDATTAKILLDMPANQVPEEKLGKGTVMIRGAVIRKAGMATVPYVDNDSLYQLLGPSTFKRERVIEVDDELVPASREETQPVTVQQVDPTEAIYAEVKALMEREGATMEQVWSAMHTHQNDEERVQPQTQPRLQLVSTKTPQERYQRAIDAYNAGHRSARKLAAALSTPERPISKEKALRIKEEMIKLGLVQEVSVDVEAL